jgi:hypothetical protein
MVTGCVPLFHAGESATTFTVRFATIRSAMASERLRSVDSIVHLRAALTSCAKQTFKNIMPNFQEQISEEELISVVTYIKGPGTRESNPSATIAELTAVYPVGPQPEKSQATPSGR